jgi:hypothetical protein
MIWDFLQVSLWPHYEKETPLAKINASRICLGDAESVKAAAEGSFCRNSEMTSAAGTFIQLLPEDPFLPLQLRLDQRARKPQADAITSEESLFHS